jgi:hypothetical protein
MMNGLRLDRDGWSEPDGPEVNPMVRRTDAWVRRLNRLLAVETQTAVTTGVLTAGEAEQLLAHLVTVIDQATDHPFRAR